MKAKQTLIFICRLPFEIFVTIFDMVVSRYIVAAVIVGMIWLPFNYLFGVSNEYWKWPTIILGAVLCGLWDCCNMFSIRNQVAKLGLVRKRDL